MYCSNCGKTQCYCYCRGCGVVWMNCQGQCGRPPMFNEVQQQPSWLKDGRNPVEQIIYDGGNAAIEGFTVLVLLYAVAIVLLLIVGNIPTWLFGVLFWGGVLFWIGRALARKFDWFTN